MATTIRLATAADAEEMTAIYSPVVENTAVSFETTPPTAEEMASRVRETTGDLPWLACEHEGTVVGYAYASHRNDRPAYRWSVDVSVYVREGRRRRGVARGLYESLFAVLRRQGFCNAVAVIALPNPASVALHEALGFERVGVYEAVGYKHGEWRDVGHWQLSLRPEPDSPSSPTSVDELRSSRDWTDAVATGESSVRL
ncbi:N-acetyltransferase [halophilic archaeon]|nr:N-acetyltransferase [halophilic archaeon]